MTGNAAAFHEGKVKTLMTPYHTPSRFAAQGKVEPELVGLPGMAQTRVVYCAENHVFITKLTIKCVSC